MRARTRTALAPLALLGLLALALFGGWLWQRGDDRAEARRDEEARVLRFTPAEVDGLTLSARGETLRVAHGVGGWQLEAPQRGAADGAAVNALLDALAGLRRRSTLAAEGDLARFGLAAPRVRVALSLAGGRTLELALGDRLALDGTAYARAGDGPVEVLARDPGAALDRSLLDLREKRLLGPGADPVRVEVAGEGTGYTLEKVGGRWRLSAPVAEPADPGAAELVSTALRALTASGFEEASRPDAARGLDPPRLDVRVTLAGRTTRLEIGAPLPGAGEDAPASRWIRRDADPELASVLASAVDPLLQPVEALRDHTVLSFDATRVARVRIEAGAGRLELTRQGGGAGWALTAPRAGPARGAPVEAMLASLSTLRALRIAGDGAAAVGAAGLSPPARTVVLLAADGSEVARLDLGREAGEGVLARPGGSERVYLVPRSVAELIPASAEALEGR